MDTEISLNISGKDKTNLDGPKKFPKTKPGDKKPFEKRVFKSSIKAPVKAPLDKSKMRPTGFENLEDMSIRGADNNEVEDVSSAVAFMLARDKKVQEEIGSTEADDRIDYVEFDDEPSFRRKKRKTDNGDVAPKKSVSKVTNFTPGQLLQASSHADVSSSPTNPASSAASPSVPSDATLPWTSLGLTPRVAGALVALNFVAPTGVQKCSIPPLLTRDGRDTLIKAPTGSGKTLSFFLPILNDLLSLNPAPTRADGTLAIAIAPTRELCIQIHDAMAALIRQTRAHYFVPGMLIGGENRDHEKARLRKGVTLLAASPGRLLDHLNNTASFKTDKLRWLVLDEADRLLDLGFEAKLRDIIGKLKDRERDSAPVGWASAGGSGGGNQGYGRRTVLLSATLHRNLSSLAQEALKNPVALGFNVQQSKAGNFQIRDGESLGRDGEEGIEGEGKGGASASTLEKYDIPSQLKQLYVEVPSKDRLMTLAALLKSRMEGSGRRQMASAKASFPSPFSSSASTALSSSKAAAASPMKVLVFLSCCDSVEFHHYLFAEIWPAACGASRDKDDGAGASQGAGFLPKCGIYKLHGNMVQAERTNTFCRFAKGGDAVLFCTDVAARGLDFPNLSCIIQYDTPCTAVEYVHRVGRTARAGSTGEAILFLLPSEKQYLNILSTQGVSLVELKATSLMDHLSGAALEMELAREASAAAALESDAMMDDDDFLYGEDLIDGLDAEGIQALTGKKRKNGGDSMNARLALARREKALTAAMQGKGGKAKRNGPKDVVQMMFHLQRRLMQAVRCDEQAQTLASSAFRSHIRAYATHSGSAAARKVFHVKNLHLGHLAYGFCLKETPGRVGAQGSAEKKRSQKDETMKKRFLATKKKVRRVANNLTR